MKKHKMMITIVVIVLMTLSVYLICNYYKYKKIESTNLSGENICGVYLMEKYNENEIEKKFGKVTKQTEEKNYYNYEYATQQFIIFLKVDKDNNIIRIAADLEDASLKTSKGIAKGSTFNDVQKSYGSNFLKESYADFMGSGNGYWIIYIDKNNRSKITFEFNEHNNGELSNMSLCKY